MDARQLTPPLGCPTLLPVAGLTNRASAARGRLVAGVWLLSFLAIVALATGGRLMESSESTSRAALVGFTAPSDATSAGVSAAPATRNAPTADVIVLSSPAMANATITTRELTIRGYLSTGVGTIRVTLEARGNRTIDEVTIEPALVFGERPTIGRHAQFEARFGLPNPRPNGRMIVQVALLDDDGGIVDVIRRPIQVGRLIERAGA